MMLIDNKREELLVSRLIEGDSSAFEELYRVYSSPIYYFVYSTLFDKSLAEDITQSCFIKIWEKRAELDTSKNFSSYLYTIAKNLVYRESERQIQDAKYFAFVKDLNENNSTTIEEEVHLGFMQKKIYDLIDQLPAARKKIFMLSRMKGYSNKEIADELSVSERTVETQIYRTLLYLKEKLKYYLLWFVLFLFS